jgi:hypothetical protein
MTVCHQEYILDVNKVIETVIVGLLSFIDILNILVVDSSNGSRVT